MFRFDAEVRTALRVFHLLRNPLYLRPFTGTKNIPHANINKVTIHFPKYNLVLIVDVIAIIPQKLQFFSLVTHSNNIFSKCPHIIFDLLSFFLHTNCYLYPLIMLDALLHVRYLGLHLTKLASSTVLSYKLSVPIGIPRYTMLQNAVSNQRASPIQVHRPIKL